jgi:hypothetical protein
MYLTSLQFLQQILLILSFQTTQSMPNTLNLFYSEHYGVKANTKYRERYFARGLFPLFLLVIDAVAGSVQCHCIRPIPNHNKQ